jgi:hypothetical protein
MAPEKYEYRVLDLNPENPREPLNYDKSMNNDKRSLAEILNDAGRFGWKLSGIWGNQMILSKPNKTSI